MPETRDRQQREGKRETAEPFVPQDGRLPELRAASASCRGCNLYKQATQTVFGEGSARAAIMLVGEQPGEAEDKQGRPFVGPAGRLLDKALAEAGVDRRHVYVTNAVKHFKWAPRGRQRLHKRPSTSEIIACQPWLEAEVRAVRPRVVVCLGAVAALGVFGPAFQLMKQRGEVLPSRFGTPTVATRHPSAILRMRGDAERDGAFQELVNHLRVAFDASNRSPP